jgi:hypothetical protein
MIKGRLVLAVLLPCSLLIAPVMTVGQEFDPEAVSQVSRGIAQWKLTQEHKGESQSQPPAHLSTPLKGIGRDNRNLHAAIGLAAFGDDYWPRSEIQDWKFSNWAYWSNHYASKIYDPFGMPGSLGGTILNTESDWVLQGSPLRVLWTPMGSAYTATATLKSTVDYLGRSMQAMDPPVYLQNNPDFGQTVTFVPSNRLLWIPTSGSWEGLGHYHKGNDEFSFHESLEITSSQTTKAHTDWATGDWGTYYHHVEIKTPVDNWFDKYATTNFPTGNYIDLQSSTITEITRTQQNYRVEVAGGIATTTPIYNNPETANAGAEGLGNNWNSIQSYAARIDWNSLPKIDWSSIQSYYPKMDWSGLPRTDWNQIQQSIPKVDWDALRRTSWNWKH